MVSVGDFCFYECPVLEKIECYAVNPPEVPTSVGANTSLCSLYVPQPSIDLYKAATGWKDFLNIYALDDSQTGISTIKSQAQNGVVADGIIRVSGLADNERVSFYTADGKLLGTAIANGGTATLCTSAKGMVIAKTGNQAIKVATE